ncbi:hypothetical protein ELH33_33025 (plasmid) [Rhizobium ruizarguesonis]|uniref:hypothetical protein n=1 Tax=Rhizobium ruizarguesonis TaxID=2081791 RepID=UPI001030D80E|nr:hypothetical protein [Rhizobium ruizarguesonis]TBC25600.1 hypothetical protein ELH33_33025 [Rhizobium ruizarguesonis]
MPYEQWTALSARIKGFVSSVELLTRQPNLLEGSAKDVLLETARQIIATINEIATAADSGQLGRILAHFAMPPIPPNGTIMGSIVVQAAIQLNSLVSEVDFLLENREEPIRLATERALRHLQWQIAADRDVQTKWSNAFTEGEVACERLGATHLLWHGICSFKAKSDGAATDLVLGEPISSDIVHAAQGLVLTEWKKVPDALEAPRLAERARHQATSYSKGLLATTELRSFRYIILVSTRQISPIDDVVVQGVTYRHVNIACDPYTPSRAATAVS